MIEKDNVIKEPLFRLASNDLLGGAIANITMSKGNEMDNAPYLKPTIDSPVGRVGGIRIN